MILLARTCANIREEWLGEQERTAGVADWDGQDALPSLLEPGLAGADQGRQPARQDQGRCIVKPRHKL